MKKQQMFAGVAAAALAGTALVMAQQGTQPGLDRPQDRPGQVNRPTQPGMTGMPGARQDSQKAVEFAREMAQLTQQWKEKHEQTTKQLQQQLQKAQSAQGEQKVDTLVQIIEKLVDEREQSIDTVVKQHAAAIRHELETANVPQQQIQQLEQQYAFLGEGRMGQPIRGIQEPNLGEDDEKDLRDPLKPGGGDLPDGPR